MNVGWAVPTTGWIGSRAQPTLRTGPIAFPWESPLREMSTLDIPIAAIVYINVPRCSSANLAEESVENHRAERDDCGPRPPLQSRNETTAAQNAPAILLRLDQCHRRRYGDGGDAAGANARA